MDSTFIKAYSRRNLDNRTGYSDPESRIGRAVKAKDLGYRLHLAVDVKSELPIAMIVVSANEKEKKHSISALYSVGVKVVKRNLFGLQFLSSISVLEMNSLLAKNMQSGFLLSLYSPLFCNVVSAII